MNASNVKLILDMAKKLDRDATFTSENGNIWTIDNESTKAIIDEKNGLFIVLHNNIDYSSEHPFTVSYFEFDTVKSAEIDISKVELIDYIKSLGEKLDDFKHIISIAGNGGLENFNVVYEKDKDGNYKLDSDGNKIPKAPKIPSIQLC